MKKKNAKKTSTNRTKTSVDKMKYEIANEFGVNESNDCNNKSTDDSTKSSANNKRTSNSKKNSKKTNKKSN